MKLRAGSFVTVTLARCHATLEELPKKRVRKNCVKRTGDACARDGPYTMAPDNGLFQFVSAYAPGAD